MNSSLSRREFFAALAVASAGVISCSESSGPTPPSPPPPPPPSPDKTALAHVIIVTMENRSFDHLLGWLPGADGKQAGLVYADRAGITRATHHLTDFQECGRPDPDHSFSGGRVEYNDGACDGWLRAGENDDYAIGYYEASDLPFLGQAARQWTVLDRYFAPFLGPTFPNRLISQAGQTDRLSNTLEPSALTAIWDRLAGAGLSGRNYGTQFVTASLFGDRYSSLIKPIGSFFADAAAGNLPNVAYVDPELSSDISNSYHPPGDIRNGEAFLSSIYKAVTTSPQWSSSLLIITFDEWGGFFDHIPPTVAPLPPGERSAGNVDGLRGFRVPTVLVSPFVRNHVSSAVYDHASILRLVEWRWDLAPLSARDAFANNLGDELDFTLPAAPAPVIQVVPGPYGGPCG